MFTFASTCHWAPWWTAMVALCFQLSVHASESDHAVQTTLTVNQELVDSAALAEPLWRTYDPVKQAEALKILQSAADKGLARAQGILGWIYLGDEGDVRDTGAAVPLIEASAAQGDARSTNLLAWLYSNGVGVTRDPDKARELLFRAAELHDANAIFQLAKTTFWRQNESVDARRVRALLDESIDAGDLRIMMFVGAEYYRGQLFDRDFQKAFALFNRASEENFLPARLWMAQCLARGHGVAPDVQRADAIFDEMKNKAAISVLNNFSWELAVSHDDAVRDGARAVFLMSQIMEKPGGREAMHLDTLAAAYAESGQYQKAIETELAAIAEAKRNLDGHAIDPSYEKRLTLYRSGRPYRE